MKDTGLVSQHQFIPVFADTVQTVALTTSPIGGDWPSGAKLVGIVSSAGAYFNGYSTAVGSGGATAPSSTPATRNEFLPPNVQFLRQITGDSSSYSILGTTAAGGVATITFFSK